MKRSYGEKNDLDLKLWIHMNRANLFIHRELADVFLQYGLSTMQFAVLEVLYHKGPLCIGDIISRILATGGNMTVVVQNLQKKHFITVEYQAKDKRRRILSLTAQGEQLLEEVFDVHLKRLNDLLSCYREDQKNDLILLLKKLKGEEENGK